MAFIKKRLKNGHVDGEGEEENQNWAGEWIQMTRDGINVCGEEEVNIIYTQIDQIEGLYLTEQRKHCDATLLLEFI